MQSSNVRCLGTSCRAPQFLSGPPAYQMLHCALSSSFRLCFTALSAAALDCAPLHSQQQLQTVLLCTLSSSFRLCLTTLSAAASDCAALSAAASECASQHSQQPLQTVPLALPAAASECASQHSQQQLQTVPLALSAAASDCASLHFSSSFRLCFTRAALGAVVKPTWLFTTI